MSSFIAISDGRVRFFIQKGVKLAKLILRRSKVFKNIFNSRDRFLKIGVRERRKNFKK